MVTADLLERHPVGEMYEGMSDAPLVHGYAIDSDSLRKLGDPSNFFEKFKRAVGVGEDFGGPSHERELPFKLGAHVVELIYVRREDETIYSIGLERNPLKGSASLMKDVVISFIDHDDPEQPVTAEWHRHSDDGDHHDGFSHPINTEAMHLVTSVKSLLSLMAS